MTCPKREAGEAIRERPGIVYPLLLRAQRPDTSIAIEAALPEAAAVGRQAHCCGHWKHQPAPTSAIKQETCFSKAVAIARRECSGCPSARHPTDTGVIRITPPCYKQSLEMTWYKQNLEVTGYKQKLDLTR